MAVVDIIEVDLGSSEVKVVVVPPSLPVPVVLGASVSAIVDSAFVLVSSIALLVGSGSLSDSDPVAVTSESPPPSCLASRLTL